MSDAVTDLFAAIHANNLEGVRLLIGAEHDLLRSVSPSGLSPVLFAAYYHRPEIVQALVELGAPLSIFEAAAAGQAARVRDMLQDNPLLVNAVSPDGFSPLGLAAFFGHEDVASALLAGGADVQAVSQNDMGVQPLHSAVAGNHARLVGALVEAGADVNATQQGGFTPLMGAAQNGNAELVALLLAHGANPAAQTADGRTAQTLAAEEKHESVLKLLPKFGPHSEETGKAEAAAELHTGRMDNEKELIGAGGAVTGVETPDPKDSDPSTLYTNTPAQDRVGAADQSGKASQYQEVVLPDAKEVTGQFDQLATRDVEAMEHTPQAPEYAGAESVAVFGVSTTALDAVVPSAGLGTDMSGAVIDQHLRSAADQNPNYTPPSKMSPPHLSERPADLPAGEPEELQDQVRGDKI